MTKQIEVGDVVTGIYEDNDGRRARDGHFIGRVTARGRNLVCIDLDGPLVLAPCRRYPQGRIVSDVVVNGAHKLTVVR